MESTCRGFNHVQSVQILYEHRIIIGTARRAAGIRGDKRGSGDTQDVIVVKWGMALRETSGFGGSHGFGRFLAAILASEVPNLDSLCFLGGGPPQTSAPEHPGSGNLNKRRGGKEEGEKN